MAHAVGNDSKIVWHLWQVDEKTSVSLVYDSIKKSLEAQCSDGRNLKLKDKDIKWLQGWDGKNQDFFANTYPIIKAQSVRIHRYEPAEESKQRTKEALYASLTSDIVHDYIAFGSAYKGLTTALQGNFCVSNLYEKELANLKQKCDAFLQAFQSFFPAQTQPDISMETGEQKQLLEVLQQKILHWKELLHQVSVKAMDIQSALNAFILPFPRCISD
jgi:hypothetical protein